MSSRRAFIGALAGATILPSMRPDAFRRVLPLARTHGGPDDEDYWGEIQRAFDCRTAQLRRVISSGSPGPSDAPISFP